MIGGADLVLHGRTKTHDTDLLIRGIRSEWSRALIQRADEVNVVPIRDFHLPVVGPAELIVYRDRASYQSWMDHGATADNQDAMIHLIVSDDSVTFVVDQPRSALAEFAWGLLESLRPNRIVLQDRIGLQAA